MFPVRGKLSSLREASPSVMWVTLTNALGKQLTWVYVADPEGNVLEIQSRPK